MELPPTTVTATAATPDTPGRSGLRGGLGVFQLVFTVMAFNAPVVVFLAFIPVAIAEGNGLGTPAAFIFCGVVIALFAVGLVAMARHLPNPGGFYAFITAGLGREIGLGAAFVAVSCYYFALVGSYALGGLALESVCSDVFDGPDITWWVWAILLFVVITVLGYFRIDLSAKILTVFLIAELILIVVYDVAVLARHDGGFSLQSFTPHNMTSGSIGIALMFGIGLFGGFEATIIFRDEVRDPRRTIPRATYAVIALVAVLYALTAWIFINASGVETVVAAVTEDSTGATINSIKDYVGPVGYAAATILLFTSSFALLLSAHNITARYAFNLSADAIIPRFFSVAHPVHGSPHRASLLTSVATLIGLAPFVIANVGPNSVYAWLVGIYSYTLIMLLFLVGIAVPVYMWRHRPEASATVWNSLICPILSVVPLGVAVVLATRNFTLLIGGSQVLANAMLLGIYGLFAAGVVLALIYKRRRPAVYACIGRQ